MKIHGTAKGAALSTKDFGVAFGGAVADTYPDSLGSGANIDETNCTIDTSEKILGVGSLSLNGSSAYADLDGSASDYGFLTEAFSLSMWLYPTNITHKDVIFDNSDVESNNVGFYFRFNVSAGNNKMLVSTCNLGASDNFETTAVWTIDEWQLLCITYNGTTMIVYRNGVNVGSASVSPFTVTPSFLPRIGWGADGNDNKYTGLIDDMALFDNRVISSGEIASLYNSGSGELVSTVFASGDRSGLKTYYNMDEITADVILNNAIPTS